MNRTTHPIPTPEEFQNWPTERVAECVRQGKPKVCVFPINGTRRWLTLEYPDEAAADFEEAYRRIGGARFIELFKLFFDHGIETLLTPAFGPDIIARGTDYMPIAEQAMRWFAQDQNYLDFYDAYDVRVRVYGDTHRYLQETSYAHVLEGFDQVAQRTAAHRRHRLFCGICAHDATESIAQIGVRFFQEHNRLPDRRQIIEAYYGEYVENVDLFIGFERFTAFDMPLLATGAEDLYFTVSPSPYLDTHILRAILYDHMYTRRLDETDYMDLLPEDWKILEDFYTLNRRHVLGLGRQFARNHFWYPLPQVKLPPYMIHDQKEHELIGET
jgi:tuberculosinol/isotuberculosinol synthase